MTSSYESLFAGLYRDGIPYEYAHMGNCHLLAKRLGYIKPGPIGDPSQTALANFGVQRGDDGEEAARDLFGAVEGKHGSAITCEAVAVELGLDRPEKVLITAQIVGWVEEVMGKSAWDDAGDPTKKNHEFLRALRAVWQWVQDEEGRKAYIVYDWKETGEEA